MPRADPGPQVRAWMLTIPHHGFIPYLPPGCLYITGQLERGTQGQDIAGVPDVEAGYLHWQVVVGFARSVHLSKIVDTFGPYHAEPVRNRDAALTYVHKPQTAIKGTQFDLGEVPLRRNVKHDYDQILNCAKSGDLDSIPSDILVRHYSSICRIRQDNLKPQPMERETKVFWGPTGTGKSRTAWLEAGWDAYPKDPRTKFWDGYHGQENVIIDEFRGAIDIAHMLRWLDRYPVVVEVKGTSTIFCARRLWITSNLHPRDWYPNLDEATQAAFLRRLEIIHFDQLRQFDE